MAFTKIAINLALLAGLATALNGGVSDHKSTVYTAYPGLSVAGGRSSLSFSSASYEYTGLGGAESNIYFAPNGDWIYSPAFSLQGVGYATSSDKGKTWTQVLPNVAQPRPQPVFREVDGTYFFWSTNFLPGYLFSYSHDQGKTWTELSGGHFDPLVQDWGKLVGGKPVYSNLTNGASEVLYLSAPSLISTPIPIQPLGPLNQLILKSTDRGVTWNQTKGSPTLQPLLSGGSCGQLLQNLADQELIIWGDGFVTKNGTIMYGLRRCQALSIAVSNDEGDSWTLYDVPGSTLPTFFPGDLAYLTDGNILVPEPISMDAAGNIFAIWVDANYVLQMSKSTDFLKTFSHPVVVGAPNTLLTPTLTYLPTLRHSSTVGRGALVYYGSTDNQKTWNGYIAESSNLLAANPTFVSIIGNAQSQPLQANDNGKWDQGYGDFTWDLVEFTDIQYEASTGNLIAALTRRMCTANSSPHESYNATSCLATGWNYTAHADSAWQGIVLSVQH